jgi:hypothetical protein
MTMQQIHVRNIFQLFIPLAQEDYTSKFSVTLLSEPSIGLALQNRETNEYWHYDVRLYSSFQSGERRSENDQSVALVWALRSPYQFQRDENSQGVLLRFKIQHHVFDFRKVKKIIIRFQVNCLNSGVLIGQASSSPVNLLPKKRQATASDVDEVTIPVFWMHELQSVTDDALSDSNAITSENKSSNESSPYEDTSNQYVGPWSSDAVEQSMQNTNDYSTDDYAIEPYNHNNTNEQYMVLYNGNAEVIGNFRALNFYKASDIRIKEDVKLLSEDQDCRDVLLKIDGVEYKFKRGVSSDTQRKFVGFIAQQIEAVVPEAVQLIDGVLHVDYQSIIPYLSEAIKQNFNDIRTGTSEREHIKTTVDLLYEDFLIREKKKSSKSQPADVESQKLIKRGSARLPSFLRIILYVIVGAAIVSSLAIGSYFIYKELLPDSPPNPDSPNAPQAPNTASFNETTDRRALMDFYIATNGGSWNDSTNWVTEVPICQWRGIKCSKDGRVTDIGFVRNYITGTLPESIGNLDQLQRLALIYTSLSGTIPESLGKLPNLESLTLKQLTASLNGTIPEFTSKYLQQFLISNARFMDTKFPDWLQKKSDLTILTLSNVNLTGTIPAWISNSKKLQQLRLENNALMGVIPPLPASLNTVILKGNQLTGDIPELSNPKFTHLDLSNNDLNGTMDKLKTLPAITWLHLQNNSLHGSVALSPSALKSVQIIDLSSNQFEFAAADLNQPTLLVQCNATANSFKCPIPQWMRTSCRATCT